MPSLWSAKILTGSRATSWASASSLLTLLRERLGISKTAMIRARAGIAYALMEAVADGHCGLPEDDLLVQAEKLLEIPTETLAEALAAEVASGSVVADVVDDAPLYFSRASLACRTAHRPAATQRYPKSYHHGRPSMPSVPLRGSKGSSG